MFSGEDRAIALALQLEDEDVCPSCKSPASEVLHPHPPTPADAKRYEVKTLWCHACAVREKKAAASDGTPSDRQGQMWAVRRQPD